MAYPNSLGISNNTQTYGSYDINNYIKNYGAYNADGGIDSSALQAYRANPGGPMASALNPADFGGQQYYRVGMSNGADGNPYDIYDSTGKFIGGGTQVEDKGGFGMLPFLTLAALAAPFALGAVGGGAASGAGAGAATSGGLGTTGASLAGGMGEFAPAGMGFSGSGALGVGGGAFGTGGLEAGLAGLGAAGAAGGGAAAGGLGSLFSNIGAKAGGSALTSGLSSLFGGGSGEVGGLNLGSIGNLIPGVVDAYQQGKASNNMLDWLKSQQAKIDNLYAPNSPEYNYLWDQLSRQDAAAGRNSQYGPRSVDLAARIAQIKADATARLTQGIAGARQNAVNQGANRFAGLSGLFGAGGGLGGLGGLIGGGLQGLLNNSNIGNSLPELANLSGGEMVTPDQADEFFNNIDLGGDGGLDISDWWS